MMTFNYTLSTSRYANWPMIIYEADADIEGMDKMIRFLRNHFGDWGDVNTCEEIGGEPLPLPRMVKLSWWSPQEQKYYYLDVDVDVERAEKLWYEQGQKEREADHFTHFVVGMAPFGIVAVWLRGYTKCVLLQQCMAKELKLREPLLSKLRNDYPVPGDGERIVSRAPFESDMRQYCFRYVLLEEYWDGKEWLQYHDDDLFYDNLDVLSVEDKRCDASYDLTGDYHQMDYHYTARPSRFCVRWREGNTHFQAHYWMEGKQMEQVWERFFTSHLMAEASLLVRIDTRARRYELALACEGMACPVTVPPEAYQQLIFRDAHEYFKSENYAQPNGAWIWRV